MKKSIFVISLIMAMMSPIRAEEITVLSYNLYFNDASGEVRYPQLLAHLSSRKPDVIGLQEVTKTFYHALIRSELMKDYKGYPEKPRGRYFNLILSKRAFSHSGIQHFPTQMGRSALYGDMPCGEGYLRFINVHLESLNNPENIAYRQAQTAALEALLSTSTVVLGDFNYSKEEPFYHQAPFNLVDLAIWAKKDERPTYDPINNPIAKQTADINERPSRLDRFYVTPTLNSLDYRLSKVFYSDHYPIEMTIECPK